MVIINVIASVLLICGISVYKFFFPKKKLNLLFLLILISLLPLISILRKGTYESGDLTLQATGITSMFNTLRDGNIIPRWAAEVFNGYGSPHHLMMYFISRYVVALLHLLGIPILGATKLFIAFSFVASGVSMYFWVRKIANEKAGFVAGILYLFAPYHLVDMHFRVEIGEMAAFIFLPLCFLFAYNIAQTKQSRWIIVEALSFAGLILSHQAVAIIFSPFLVIFMVLLLKDSKMKGEMARRFILSIVAGALVTAFYWAPVLFEASRFTWIYNMAKNPSEVEFHSLMEYIYSPWRYGLLFQGPAGQLSFIVGYAHWIILGTAVFLLFKKRIIGHKKLLLFCVVSFFIIFFFMQRVSSPLWNSIPLIKYSQNSYRLLLILAFFTSSIGGIITSYIKQKWIVISICVFVTGVTILNWGNRRTIPEISDDAYFAHHAYIYFTGVDGKGSDFSLPIWADIKKTPFRKPASSSIQTMTGRADFKQVFRNTTKHEYIADVTEKSVIRENTLYFPGWNLYINNKPQLINYQRKELPGIITFDLKKGLYKIEVIFQNTLLRTIADTISFITLILLFMLSIKQLKFGKLRFPKLKI